MLTEGKEFVHLKTFRYEHMSLWMGACSGARESSPLVLQKLLDAGCDIAERSTDGFNCLFHSVMKAKFCSTSDELQRLQFLLSKFEDIYAKDAQGCTVFDRVDTFTGKSGGSYQRDLWYCALERAGIDVSLHTANHPRMAAYEADVERNFGKYTPEHYHALKHLQSWSYHDFRPQMDRLLKDIPLNEEESREMERIREKRRELQRTSEEDWDEFENADK